MVGPMRRGLQPSYEGRLQTHLNMVVDPCNAPIGPTAYRGKDGFITRFSNAFGAGDGTATTCVVAYWPKYNRVFRFNAASSATTFSIDFYGVAGEEGPGGPFLGTNASEIRPVGACITSVYTGTELDRQGFVVRGVVPYKSVSGTVTADKLCNLLQLWNRTPSGEIDTKWIPSPDDENYIQTPSSNPDVAEDSNIILLVYRNYAAGKISTVFRVTTVLEWQPYYGLGISSPSPNTTDPPGGLERVRTALSSLGHWWLEARSTIATAAGVGRMVARDARAIVGYARAVPMLTMG